MSREVNGSPMLKISGGVFLGQCSCMQESRMCTKLKCVLQIFSPNHMQIYKPCEWALQAGQERHHAAGEDVTSQRERSQADPKHGKRTFIAPADTFGKQAKVPRTFRVVNWGGSVHGLRYGTVACSQGARGAAGDAGNDPNRFRC